MTQQEEPFMDRLKVMRETLQSKSQDKSRLEGELSGLKKINADVKKKCKEEFDSTMEELPDSISELKEAAEKSAIEAEETLGIRESSSKGSSDTPKDESPSEEEEYEDDGLV